MRPGQTPSVPGNDRAAPNAAAIANFNMIFLHSDSAAYLRSERRTSGLVRWGEYAMNWQAPSWTYRGGLIGYAALSPGDTGASGLYIFLDLVVVGVLWASIGAKLAKLVVREGR